jgi:1-acyl-sn-glycerol-3-phosphate acyltransferase
MNAFNIFFRRTWRVFFFLNGALMFLILFPLFKILLSKEKWFPHAFKLKKVLARLIVFNTGISVKKIGTSELDRKQAYVFCPNHTSFLDIVVSYLVIPNYFHYIGKAELLKVPFFNIFFKKMNIVVDRGSIMASHRAFQRSCDDIDKHISIAIFPEATIPVSTPELGNFKNGPFKLAIEKQIPIVPITYLDNWRILPDAKKHLNKSGPGCSRVFIHEPIPTKGLTDEDMNELKKKVYLTIHKSLEDYHIIAEGNDLQNATHHTGKRITRLP